MHPETLEAIRKSAAVPSMPLIATRCYEMTQDPMCSFDKLCGLLSTDPGMTSELLRLANSPLFGVMRKVESLKHAIALLGLGRIRDLVLTRYMVQSFSRIKTDPIDMSYFWRRSLTTAVVATRLAEAALPRRRDEGFLAGLLSDVGVLILIRALPSKYANIAAWYRPFGGDAWIKREAEQLGVTHAEVSALVLEEWSLPVMISDAIRHHHTPAEAIPADAPGRPLAPLLGAAGAVSMSLCEVPDATKAAEYCVGETARAGISPRTLADVLPRVADDVKMLGDILHIDIIASKTYEMIAHHIAEKIVPATPS